MNERELITREAAIAMCKMYAVIVSNKRIDAEKKECRKVCLEIRMMNPDSVI